MKTRKFILRTPQDSIEIVCPDDAEIGDEYYTIKELYDHRLALTVALTRYYSRYYQRIHTFYQRIHTFGLKRPGEYAFRSKFHHDGTMFDGDYFIVGLVYGEKMIISYHYHLKHWDLFEHCETLERAPEYDGYDSIEVVNRLMRL